MTYPGLRVSRLVGVRRLESIFILETKDTEKISTASQRRGYTLSARQQRGYSLSARQRRGYSLSARQRRGYSLSARQRRGYRSWDQQRLRASLALESCWSGCESLGYFLSSTLDIHNLSPGSVRGDMHGIFKGGITLITTNLYRLYKPFVRRESSNIL